jgi:hypothetical protein
MAVVKIGSSAVKFACGTNRNVGTFCAIAGAASTEAAAVFNRVRRSMAFSPVS